MASLSAKRLMAQTNSGTMLQGPAQDARSFWLAREASAVNWKLKQQQSPSGRAVRQGIARASNGQSDVVVSCTSRRELSPPPLGDFAAQREAQGSAL